MSYARGTHIGVEQSQAELVALVASYGFGPPALLPNGDGRMALEFAGDRLVFVEPAFEQERREFWRTLKLVVQARLEQRRLGIVFEQAPIVQQPPIAAWTVAAQAPSRPSLPSPPQTQRRSRLQRWAEAADRAATALR